MNIGFSILYISKTIIYNFLWKYLNLKYGDKVVSMYTDTDRLIIYVFQGESRLWYF